MILAGLLHSRGPPQRAGLTARRCEPERSYRPCGTVLSVPTPGVLNRRGDQWMVLLSWVMTMRPIVPPTSQPGTNEIHCDATRVESRSSWVIATVALAVLTISYGAPLVTVVAMKPIAAEFGTSRSAPALAVSLTYIGSGLGGILMGWISGRVGVRRVVIGCGAMLAAGLIAASFGGLWSLYLCNLLLVGLLGAAGMFSPMMAYVTRWFDEHRGSAVALVSSGQYVAGALWPLVLQLAVGMIGWRSAMLLYGVLVIGTIVPLAAVFFRTPPEVPSLNVAGATTATGTSPVLGPPPNLVMGLLALAIFCCCVTMAMPLSHMVAFCSDIGIGPVHGAAMLSTQLAIGFIAQQMWGWLADRLGGLATVLCLCKHGGSDGRLSSNAE